MGTTFRRHGQGNEGNEGQGCRRRACCSGQAHEEGHEGHEGESHEGHEGQEVRRRYCEFGRPAVQRTPVVLAAEDASCWALYHRLSAPYSERFQTKSSKRF